MEMLRWQPILAEFVGTGEYFEFRVAHSKKQVAVKNKMILCGPVACGHSVGGRGRFYNNSTTT
jgi:hypothetical protein